MKRLLFSFTCLLIATTAIAQWHEIKSPTEQPQQKTETKKTESNPPKSSKTSSSKSSKKSSAPLCPDGKHPHMIDLGLPSGTKWACCNVGADKPEAYGGYYAWGETETKGTYDWKTYIHCDGSKETCHDIGSDIAGTKYDVAHVKWGGSWVMPSLDQSKELLDNCKNTWTSVNGKKGRKFTGKNGRSIFLPAAGYRWGDGLGSAGSYGYYWSSTQLPSDSYFAYSLSFDSDGAYWSGYYRNYGHPVRPVSK